MLAILLAGCWSIPTEVQLSGTVLDHYQGSGLSGVDIEVDDALDTFISDGLSGEGGAFDIKVPASQSFYLTFSGEGFVPTAFTGLAGASDLVAPDGVLYLRSVDELAALRTEFSACPTAQEAGPVVEGIVRVYLPVDDDPETLPIATEATVTVYDVDDNEFAACYLDDDGASMADGTATTNSGRFAVFGVPEGPLSVRVQWQMTDTVQTESWYIVRAPAEGVAPMYPAWVQSP